MKKSLVFLATLLLFSCNAIEKKESTAKDEVIIKASDWKAYKAKHLALRESLGAHAAKIQTFNINPKQDTVLMSEYGTLLFVPEHNFADSKGNLIEGPLQLSFIELPNAQIAAMNKISTVTDKGELLETNGMYYLEAKIAGSEEKLHYKKSIRVEVQSFIALPNPQLYEGIWKGDNLVWDSNTKALGKDMTPISIEALLSNTDKALGAVYEEELIQKKLTQYILPICMEEKLQILLVKDSTAFQQTWIATQEFKARMRCIEKTCDVKVFELYINNTDKMLWEVDQMAADYLEKNKDPQAENFRKFAQIRNTNLWNFPPLPKDLLDKVKRSANTLASSSNTAAWLNYPISFSFGKDEWHNIDCIIRGGLKKGLEDVSVNCTLKGKNIVPEDNFTVSIFLKNGSSGLNMSEDNNRYNFNFQWIPDAQFIILARSKDGSKVGFAEVMPKKGVCNFEILVKPADKNVDVKSAVEKYFLPRSEITFTNTKRSDCDDAYCN
jgi:hypothetical protein